LFGIFSQIERGKHAEGDDGEAHDDDHHDGSKNGRENATLSVGFSGLGGEDRPHIREIGPALVQQTHLVRAQGTNDLSYWDLYFSSIRIHHKDRVFIELCAQRFQFHGFFLVTRFSGGSLGFEIIDMSSLPRIGDSPHFERTDLQPCPFDVCVNRANFNVFYSGNLLMEGVGGADQWCQSNPSTFIPFCLKRLSFVDSLDPGIHVPPFAAFQEHNICRRSLRHNLIVVDPFEIKPI
jgi:hypothetical protein